MNTYEALLDEADNLGLKVKELPLESSDGRIKGKRIAIRRNIATTCEKACTLAEEIGHDQTTVGHILDTTKHLNAKQERQARLWSYNRMIGLDGLIRAFEHGCRDEYEIADFLEVPHEYLVNAIECYRSKYGIHTVVDNYLIYFIPNLIIGKLFKK